MFLLVTFSSYNRFCLFFFSQRLGPKARFSDYNISPFTPFFISQNIRNIYKIFFTAFVSKPNVKTCLTPASKKIPGSFASRSSRGKQTGEPGAIFAECHLFSLAPDTSASISPPPRHPHSYDMGVGCLAWAFRCHYCCLLFSSLATESGPSFPPKSGNSQDSAPLGVRPASCIVRAWLAAPPEGGKFRGARTSWAASVCVRSGTGLWCPLPLAKLGNPLFTRQGLCFPTSTLGYVV